MAAAGVTALAAAKAISQDTAGITRQVLQALEKPIYTNLVVVQTTHTNKKGNIVVTTRSKGWTIPLGLPVLIIGSIAMWEVGNFVAQGLSKTFGVVPAFSDLMDPGKWISYAYTVGVDTSKITSGGITGNSVEIASGFLGLWAAVTGQVPAGTPKGTPATVKVPASFMAALSTVGIQALIPVITILQTLVGNKTTA